MTQIIYNFDEEGYFTGKSKANIDPLETKIKKKDIYLLPRNATFTKTPKPQENKRIKWDKNNQKWIYEDIKILENPQEEIESELGDVLFSIVNFARLSNLDPELALERTNKKFIYRFTYMEKKAQEEGKSLNEMTLPAMELLWNEAKAQSKD